MKHNNVFLSIASVLLLIIPKLLSAQAEQLVSGPMVGYAEMREVQLWVQTKKTDTVKISYWKKGSVEKKFSEDFITDKNKAYSTKITITGLKPGNRYNYELYINNVPVKRDYLLEFQSTPYWTNEAETQAPNFRMVLGSCFNRNYEGSQSPKKTYGSIEIFDSIYTKHPDFMLWMGDNLYLSAREWNSKSGIDELYTFYRSTPELQKLFGSVHHYAGIDDHDYGPNNADGTFWNKETTEEAFRYFWSNPNYGVASALGKGATGTFVWGDAQFFLLDDRYFRTPLGSTFENPGMLGKEQIDWLIGALKMSDANFKLVMVGTQVLNPSPAKDLYSNYPEERAALLQRIKDEKIEGVIFLSGDIHYTEMTKLDRPGDYPLYELTSSSLTSTSKAEPMKNPLRVDGTLLMGHSFATIDFIGEPTERKMLITIFDDKGIKIWDKIISRSDLSLLNKK
ncbi:MAG: alkaline phosphatase family protein [Bacteroidetes bacterium]|nr:MAG: alkaline phosphatase family protein [Bacteroidota bacterium]